MKLSEHFDSIEFQCPCGACGEPYVDAALINALEEMRARLAAPLVIGSGYRCAAHNKEKAVGGVPGSFHMQGKAADVSSPGKSAREIYQAATMVERFRRGGIGVNPEKNFVHVDVRFYVARWGYRDGHQVAFALVLPSLAPPPEAA